MKIFNILLFLIALPVFAQDLATAPQAKPDKGKEIVKADPFMDKLNADILKNPSITRIMFRADILVKDKKYDQALEDYNKIVEMDKSLVTNITIKKALLYADQGMVKEAEDQLKKAKETAETKAFLIDGGKVYEKLKDFSKAIEYYKTLEKEDPSLHYINKPIGDCYLRMEKFPEAKEAYLKMIESVKDHVNMKKQIAEYYVKLCMIEVMSKGEKAQEYLAEAVKYDPEIMYSMLNLAF